MMRDIEIKKAFSQSMLWDLQRRYFHEKGVDAWASQVPFYITSNPVIAHTYAQIFIQFMRDLKSSGQWDSGQAIYILELGTGSGRFSYYCLQELVRLQALFELNDVKFCYIMSDFTQRNIDFWDQHALLKPFVSSGHLDFALYNLETDTHLHLIKQNKTLEKNSLKNPLLVVGNYIFDTITHDVFRVQDRQVLAAPISLRTDETNMQGDAVVALEKLAATFSYQPMSTHYYEHAILNAIVEEYQKTLTTSTVIFPIGGLIAIERLKEIAQGKLLLISTDKGYTHLSELEGRADPRVVFHGSFSMSVNFHAIGEYFKRSQGDAYFQSLRRAIKTCVFVAGFNFKNLKNTHNAMNVFVEDFSPGDYFNMHEHLKKTKTETTLPVVLSHLHLTHFDPHVFKFFIEHIMKNIREAEAVTIDGLCFAVSRIAEHVYPMPGAHDTYFDIGLFLQSIERYPLALTYYQKSYTIFQKTFNVLYNMGLCHYYLRNTSMALACFKESLTYPSANIKNDSNAWIARIEFELSHKK